MNFAVNDDGELDFSIADATTQEPHAVTIAPDAHGCVITIGEKHIIVDCNKSIVSVYLQDDEGADTNELGHFRL